jgi:hypothetical protein
MGMRIQPYEEMDVVQKWYRTSTTCTKIGRDLYFLRRVRNGCPLCQVRWRVCAWCTLQFLGFHSRGLEASTTERLFAKVRSEVIK